MFLTRPELAFRCQHADDCPTDVCVSIRFDPGAVSGFGHAWESAGWVARPSATPRLAYVERRIADAAANADRFQIERWALAALTALDVDTARPTARGHYAVRGADVDAVVAACRSIETDPISRRSIADRARDVALTSTQLTHLFRRYVGASPHRYVMHWRLALGAELLDSGLSVSESCYRCGFENLSHFCRTFQRTFGVRASMWRTLAHRERRRRAKEARSRLGVQVP